MIQTRYLCGSFHHRTYRDFFLNSQERRSRAVDELVRILRPGGKGLVYVWALEQERNNKKSNYLKAVSNTSEHEAKSTAGDTRLKPTSGEGKVPKDDILRIHTNRTRFEAQDLLVPWHLRKPKEQDDMNSGKSESASNTFLRFYHVFVEGELEELIKRSSFGSQIKITRSYYDKGNWCAIFEKL